MASNVITVDIKALPKLLRSSNERIREGVYAGALAGAHRARGLIVKRTPVDLGGARAGWRVRTVDARPSSRARAMVTVAELYNDMPQIVWLEFGTRPHKVSAEGWAAIYEWARRHFRGTGGRMKRGRVTGPFTGADPDLTRITWGIVRKINREGQKPTLFVYKSLDEMRRLMGLEMVRQLNAVSARIASDARRGGR